MENFSKLNYSETKIRNEVEFSIRSGKARFITFHGLSDQKEHIAVVCGDLKSEKVPLVRMHSECMTGDVFGSARCDCGEQLNEALDFIQKNGGILIYLRQEGRGIGLYNKLDAYRLQDKGYDTYAANQRLGFDADERNYQTAAEILYALNTTHVQLLTNNPDKVAQLESFGIKVTKRISTGVYLNPENRQYLEAKVKKTQHSIALPGLVQNYQSEVSRVTA